jgi:hypothetical protein
MNKRENILKDINNIDQKIKKLEAQKNLLLIQLESIKNNPGAQSSGNSDNPIERLRNMNNF